MCKYAGLMVVFLLNKLWFYLSLLEYFTCFYLFLFNMNTSRECEKLSVFDAF
jgi:hypothetical protein